VKPGGDPGYCHKAVVLGAGPVGLLGAMVLTAQGFETYVYSREKPPSYGSRICDAIGAEYISSADHTIEELAADAGNIDVVYEATGASRLAFDVMRVIGTNGVFVFTGVPGRKAPVEVDTGLIMRRLVLDNQVVFGAVNAGRESFEAAIRDLEIFRKKWPDALPSLITGRFPLDQAADLLTGSRGGIKNVVAISS
jgi:threonine dehydrogenase-like Zn-dependent dehydrogenase